MQIWKLQFSSARSFPEPGRLLSAAATNAPASDEEEDDDHDDDDDDDNDGDLRSALRGFRRIRSLQLVRNLSVSQGAIFLA